MRMPAPSPVKPMTKPTNPLVRMDMQKVGLLRERIRIVVALVDQP